MEYREKIEYLKQYQKERQKEQLLAEQIGQIETQVTHITPALTGMPGGGGDPDKIPKAVERLVEEKEALKRQLEQSAAVRKAVLRVIDTLDSARDRELLTRRYILGQRWEEIAEKMHLDIRWITRLHRRIVETVIIFVK